MDFQFSEEQNELRKAARRFLESESDSETVKKVMETEAGFDPETWSRVAEELGWLAVTIPEEYDGLGLSQVDLMPILEETGRYLFCSPFFSTICLGTNALLLGGTDEQKKEHLPRIAMGELTATVAYTGRSGRWDASTVEATYRREGDDFLLDGELRYVLDGHTADLLLVAARRQGTEGSDGVSLFAVPSESDGLARELLPTIDQTRKQAALRLDTVRVPKGAILGEESKGWTLLRATLDRALASLAVEQVGGAERCLDMAVAYTSERKQFGRPVGSFQAIKHKAADMLTAVESARSIAYYAGLCVAEGSAELPEVAAAAKAYCSDAYFHCAAENIQMHGGVGFTWEYDPHLYFKRAKSSEALFGNPAMHREIVAQHMGL